MDAATTHLLARASLYHMLATAYDYPGPTQRERIVASLNRAAPLLEAYGGPWPRAAAELRTVLEEARQAPIEAEFNLLFAGTVECPPHETAYEPDVFRRQRALADLAGFYEAFGFRLADDSRWQLDHLGVELDFCAAVLQRHARARAEGWEEPAVVCAEAVRVFLEDHTGRWCAAFSRRLARSASTPYYVTVAALTGAWIHAELLALGVDPDPLADRPRGAPEDEASPSCGGCPVAAG